jgi:ubiquitin carboxyl-terminal hydrolase 4/11/15
MHRLHPGTDDAAADVYKDELNPDNPLGMHGAIAEAFGALLHRVWARSGPATSYAPREFKQALQRFAPQFSGYQQHDSQELVAFLLDGLHEDLNRILQKPYVEKPDWTGGGAREMCALARASWDGYLQRNDSVIVDLFQGQYRSTLVCPECEKVWTVIFRKPRYEADGRTARRYRSRSTRSCTSRCRCRKRSSTRRRSASSRGGRRIR